MSASPAEGSDAWKAQDKGPTIVIVCWVVTAISTSFVIGRVYVRGKIMKKFQSDDWFIVLGQFCGYISTALSTIAVTYGNGRHMSLLSIEQQEGAILWTTAAFCPGIMSFGLPKLAVVSLLVRLMNPGRYHKWSLWDFSVKGTCFDVNILVAYCIYAGSFSAFVDVYLAVYPAIILFGLQMATKKKIALSCALGIGSILPHADDTSDLVIWTVVEGSTIIIASSIPVMQPLLELILRRNPFSSAKDSKQTPKYYEDYSSQSKSRSRGGGGIELGQRKPKVKPKDELGLTIVEGDSQENILTPTSATNQDMFASSEAPTLISVQNDANQRPADGKIMRTDLVSITYEEQGPAHDTSASSRWKAI
ncbi:integral membrane protein [Colletotrichum fioriniae PJ7]|uniref:Integral membrane protein n=1 Tax=Colletotrichum fioriniae PJ7 TaxID=1445577 RepID=A0A010R9Y5_9PEZI|nr:integral membrane protein [Colletotrichum fioriniae PJ7]